MIKPWECLLNMSMNLQLLQHTGKLCLCVCTSYVCVIKSWNKKWKTLCTFASLNICTSVCRAEYMLFHSFFIAAASIKMSLKPLFASTRHKTSHIYDNETLNATCVSLLMLWFVAIPATLICLQCLIIKFSFVFWVSAKVFFTIRIQTAETVFFVKHFFFFSFQVFSSAVIQGKHKFIKCIFLDIAE